MASQLGVIRLSIPILAVVLVGACTSSADPGASAATATPAPTPTSPLFGQAPPVDPCRLLRRSEVHIVLQATEVEVHPGETNAGATTTCFYEADRAQTFVRLTVVKEPTTEAAFTEQQRAWGERASLVDDLDAPTYVVDIGPLVTVYSLKDDIAFYVDVARDELPGSDLALQAVGLTERALSRFP